MIFCLKKPTPPWVLKIEKLYLAFINHVIRTQVCYYRFQKCEINSSQNSQKKFLFWGNFQIKILKHLCVRCQPIRNGFFQNLGKTKTKKHFSLKMVPVPIIKKKLYDWLVHGSLAAFFAKKSTYGWRLLLVAREMGYSLQSWE